MRQFVDQNDLRLARQDGVDVHLLEGRAPVLKLPPGYSLQLGRQLGNGLAAVRLHHSHHDILAAALAADALTEHVVGLAHSRGVPQEQLEDALLLLRCGFFQPLLGGFWHRGYSRRERYELSNRLQSLP